MSNAGNFVSVPNETAARNYPIAPGNSVTFIDENNPYCYTKTMGLNQLDRPVFKRYRLVEETEPIQSAQNAPTTSANTEGSIAIPEKINADIAALRALYDELKLDVEIIKEDMSNAKSADAKSLTSE
jgi:hypothetical protein